MERAGLVPGGTFDEGLRDHQPDLDADCRKREGDNETAEYYESKHGGHLLFVMENSLLWG